MADFPNQKRKVYHITDRRNLRSIARKGLIPHQDNSIAAVEIKKGKVINVLLDDNKKDLDFMGNYFHSRAVSNFDTNYYPVILEADVDQDKVKEVHKKKVDFKWGIVQEPIPSRNIRIKGTLVRRYQPDMPKLSEEFENDKQGE